jgi:hypothetical protein
MTLENVAQNDVVSFSFDMHCAIFLIYFFVNNNRLLKHYNYLPINMFYQVLPSTDKPGIYEPINSIFKSKRYLC